jgi:cell division protein FtsB
MNDIQPSRKVVKTEKKKTIRTLYSKPVLIGLLVLIVILVRATWGVFQKEQESRRNVAMVHAELQTLNERKMVLERETNKLNTQEGIENAIREKFQVSKEGESVLVVVDKPLPASTNEENKNFFFKMWDSVSGIFKKDEATTTDSVED